MTHHSIWRSPGVYIGWSHRPVTTARISAPVTAKSPAENPMTQVATQITLSVSDRIRDWSRQERDLAIALRGLHLDTPRPALPLDDGVAPSLHNSSLSVDNGPIHRDELPIEATQFDNSARANTAPPAIIPCSPIADGADGAKKVGHFYGFSAAQQPEPVEPAEPEPPVVPPGPFDHSSPRFRIQPLGPVHRQSRYPRRRALWCGWRRSDNHIGPPSATTTTSRHSTPNWQHSPLLVTRVGNNRHRS